MPDDPQTTLYVVERQGVYHQGVVGLCKELPKAIEVAKEAAAAEPDDYHDFIIEEHFQECLTEGRLVATIRRNKKEISVEIEHAK